MIERSMAAAAGDRAIGPTGRRTAAVIAENATRSVYFSHLATRISAAAMAPNPPRRATSMNASSRGDGGPPAISPTTMLRGPLAVTTPGSLMAAMM